MESSNSKEDIMPEHLWDSKAEETNRGLTLDLANSLQREAELEKQVSLLEETVEKYEKELELLSGALTKIHDILLKSEYTPHAL